MAWYSDEEYLFRKDTADKKVTARSARHTRTHCGKGGSVKFPSDFMSKKERDAMNGECKYYRMNDPITWDEFKALPDDLKKLYIKNLKDKFNVPNSAFAEMFGVHQSLVGRYFKCLGISDSARGRVAWNKEGFLAWRHGVPAEGVRPSETPVDSEETPVEPIVTVKELAPMYPLVEMSNNETKETESSNSACTETHCLVPMCGDMTFEGNAHDILRTIGQLLNGKNVHLNVKWDVLED